MRSEELAMMWTPTLRLFVLAPMALAACAPPEEAPLLPDEPAAAASQALVSSNGRSLNGRSLNGRSLNGRSLNGRSLNGVSLEGVTLAGALTGEVWLQGTVFHGVDDEGEALSKKDFVGAVFTGTLDDQTTLALRIDAMSPSPEDHSIQRYAVSYATDEGRRPLCVDDDGDPTTAIPLQGRWSYAEGAPGGGAKIADPSAFTFACRGHALAKCVELGYAPWKSVKVKAPGGHGNLDLSLADHHQACTRLIRADYCGDGSANTVDGTLLNLYDGIGIQDDTEGWSFEAEWGPGGARCVSRAREAGGVAPACWQSLQSGACGAKSHFATGTLLMDEDTP
jgi:hypothetical protein